MKDLIQKKFISTCDMHCGGAPVRIIESGFPDVPEGIRLQDCIPYLKNNLDQWRRMLMHEPRGHSEMVGALLLPPSFSDHTINAQPVVFMHHNGYWAMCGHMTLALTRYFAEKRLGESSQNGNKENDLTTADEVKITFQFPCGLVNGWYTVRGPERGWSRFTSVKAFVEAKDIKVTLSNNQIVSVDIAFGGSYFAIVPIKLFGFEFGKTPFSQFAKTGQEIQDKLNKSLKLKHPAVTVADKIIAVVFTDDNIMDSRVNGHMPRQLITKHCIAYDGRIDMSPCGSGSTCRMALLFDKKLINKDDSVKFISAATNESFVGNAFISGQIHELFDEHGNKCVTVNIKGQAYFTGRCQFTTEPEDNLACGFSVE